MKESTEDLNLQLINNYLVYLLDNRGLSENTLAAYRQDFLHFNNWLHYQQLSLIAVDSAVISRYFIWRMTENFKPSSSARIVSSLKGFYRQLLIAKKIQLDPCFGIQLNKYTRPVPAVLSLQEVDKLLAAPDTTTLIGKRDKAMLEFLYATGINITELIGLRLSQVNLKTGLVYLDKSGVPSRTIPLTDEAIFCLKKYLSSAGRGAKKQPDVDWVFLSNRESMMTRQTFWYRMKFYAQQASITQNVSPQSLRIAFAAHLLNNGANLQWVQSILGHCEVHSTQYYSGLGTKLD